MGTVPDLFGSSKCFILLVLIETRRSLEITRDSDQKVGSLRFAKVIRHWSNVIHLTSQPVETRRRSGHVVCEDGESHLVRGL